MMKRLVSTAALSLILSGAALAQAPAPSADAHPPQAGAETTAPAVTTEAPAPTTEAIAPSPTETGSITQQTDTAPQAPETAAVPDSVDSCIKKAVDLGSTAESKTLTPENAEHLDALFSKMETLCDGEQFAEAVTVEKDIRSIIDAN